MVCAIVLLFVIFNHYLKKKADAYVYAVIAWTLFMFGVTEFLSVFNALTMGALWLCWSALDVIMLVTALKGRMFKPLGYTRITVSKYAVFCIAVAGGGILLLAVRTIPYNWDSMTYHLGRIVHWAQNRSVAHYGTHIMRQVFSPMLAEFVNLHVYIMSNGNDYLLNLLQCFAYFSNGWLVYRIAGKLKCGPKYCVLAAVLFYSAPIAFAEALTTQVDNYAALFLLIFVYLLLDFLHMEEKLAWNGANVFKVVMLSLCVGFGYLSKPSVCIAMLIFAVWLLLISICRRDAFSAVLRLVVIAVPCMLMILAPESLRNMHTFKAFTTSNVGSRQLIGSLHERYLVVNFVKNFTLNLPTIWLYNSQSLIRKYVGRFSGLLGIDINNPAISDGGREFAVSEAQNYFHDTAVNPVIVWLLILTWVMLLGMIRKWKWARLKEIETGYYLSAVGSFLLFCMILRWGPFASRFMIAYLALLCPAVVIVLERFMTYLRLGDRHKTGLGYVLVFCILVEVWGLFYYHSKIAFADHDERAQGYFAAREVAYAAYKDMSDYLNQMPVENIGLVMDEDIYEYPLWKMCGDFKRMEHVNVTNDTGIYEDVNFIPEVILVFTGGDNKTMECHGYEYEMAQQFDGIWIYEKK